MSATNNMESALRNLNRLSEEEKSAALEELLRNPSKNAINVVLSKVRALDEQHLTDDLLKSFGSAAYSAMHQLDRLRPSQQFGTVHKVSDDLESLLEDAERYAPDTRLCLIARVAGVYSHCVEEGEVFRLLSQGGFETDLCSSMNDALAEITDVDDAVVGKLESAMSQLERVHQRLCSYGIEEFQDVVDEIDRKLPN